MWFYLAMMQKSVPQGLTTNQEPIWGMTESGAMEKWRNTGQTTEQLTTVGNKAKS